MHQELSDGRLEDELVVPSNTRVYSIAKVSSFPWHSDLIIDNEDVNLARYISSKVQKNYSTWLEYEESHKREVVVYYRKIPKIVQRPLLRALYLEVVIFGGAYLRREICVSKSIELALQLEVNLPFMLRFTLYLSAIFQAQAAGGAYIWRGDLTEGFLRYRSGGVYFWNFTVYWLLRERLTVV